MEVLILLTYGAICFAAFRFLHIPVNGFSVVTAVLGGVMMLGALLFGMNFNHPYSVLARTYFVSTPIVPAVRGRVVEVPVTPNAPLAAGDVLFRLDPAPFQRKVDELEASLALVRAQVATDEDTLAAAQARLDAARGQQTLAQQQYDRDVVLVRDKAIPEVRLEQRRSQLDSADGAVAAAEAEVREARDVRGAAVGDGRNARLAEIEAQLDNARWDLDQATVRAPTDGYVTQVALREGFYAVPLPLRPAMVFVSQESRRVVASFRQIAAQRLDVGRPAEVAFHAVPGRIFTGRVASILPVIAAGELQAGGTLVAPEQRLEPGRITALIELDDTAEALHLPGGAAGVAAVYSEHVEPLSLLRRILLRMRSWTFYLSFED